MTQEQIEEFLHNVYSIATQYPELQARVTQAFQQGTNEYIANLKQQTSDMETLAVAYAAISEAKGKDSKATKMWAYNLIVSKLSKHQSTTAFMNWSANIKASRQYLKAEGLIK